MTKEQLAHAIHFAGRDALGLLPYPEDVADRKRDEYYCMLTIYALLDSAATVADHLGMDIVDIIEDVFALARLIELAKLDTEGGE